MTRLGRPSIYPGKDKTRGRATGLLTPAGWRAFEKGRRAAALLHGVKVQAVTDADTIEFLAREFDDRK